MEITVLCKVVDNFGDIGVVWRLCKNLKAADSSIKLNLIVDDLCSFYKICSVVKTDCDVQQVFGVNVYNWFSKEFCHKVFSKNDGEKLSVILECFQCGRPDWMETILFEEKLDRTVNIIMIDYLTAEKYAEDFHCLKSLTRSAKVQKVNFMPGFTSKTGGLIIDDEWKNLSTRNKAGPVLIFTYERNWTPLASALNKALPSTVSLLLAQGRGKQSFRAAYDSLENKSCSLDELDFIDQEQWDKVMKNCSALVIRGEESMSRACLCGLPFIWQAYPQSEEYQLVKVEALLNAMKPFFKDEDFTVVRNAWLAINSPEGSVDDEEGKYKNFFSSMNELEYGFKDFALQLRKNGDLCANLMTFIKKITIMV